MKKLRDFTIVFATLLACLPFVSAGPKASIFFFDPDTPSFSFVELKAEFQKYLNTEGLDYAFQPVSKRENLQVFVKKQWPRYIILSPFEMTGMGVAAKYGIGLKLKHKDKDGSRKYFIKSRIANSKTPIVASSLNFEVIQKVFSGKAQKIFKTGRQVTITKDIDGILAVYNGQADYAIVAQDAYHFLEKKNKDLKKKTSIIEQSRLIPHPVLYVLREHSASGINDKLLKSLTVMHKKDAGKKVLDMLGYDKWYK
jgi:hypothetical protein